MLLPILSDIYRIPIILSTKNIFFTENEFMQDNLIYIYKSPVTRMTEQPVYDMHCSDQLARLAPSNCWQSLLPASPALD